MKTLKLLLATLLVIVVSAGSLLAQSKADIFNNLNEITWLGLDFTQAKFIGTAYQFKEAGQITDAEFKDKHSPGWNQLFIDEAKKYDVAEAVNRVKVNYATEVTDKVNSTITTSFFSENPDDYHKLNEDKIKAMVKNYDLKDRKGIGMVFIVDGMSKAKDEGNAWVTFVDMKTKQMLLTKYLTGKAKGFGFRNYWAGCFLSILKDVKSNYKTWQG